MIAYTHGRTIVHTDNVPEWKHVGFAGSIIGLLAYVSFSLYALRCKMCYGCSYNNLPLSSEMQQVSCVPRNGYVVSIVPPLGVPLLGV